MIELAQLKEKLMQDPEFVKEYEAIQPEMDAIRALLDARDSLGLTQKELSKLSGVGQADISKLENGVRNPSVALLRRLANAMDMDLKIEFVPRHQR